MELDSLDILDLALAIGERFGLSEEQFDVLAGGDVDLQSLRTVDDIVDRASIYQSTQQLYQAFEEKVRQFPEQWIGWTMLASHIGVELQQATSARTPTIS